MLVFLPRILTTLSPMKSTQLFLFLPLIGALAGCGQIGPLYLPTKATSVPVQIQTNIKPQPNANQDH